MDGSGVFFLIMTMLLIGLLLFIKFSKKGQSFVCDKCPMCPSGQRIGLKYNPTDDKLVNNVINTINTTIDAAQGKYMTCSSLSKYIPEPLPKGTKCGDLKKKLESGKIPSDQKDIVDAQQKYIDTFIDDLCLSDGTIDYDKLSASSKILQKTFCV